MAVIRMETDEVLETARQIDLLAGDLYYQPGKLNSLAGSLTSNWQGGSAGRYAARLRGLAKIVQGEAIRLQRLAVHARQEVSEWEAADNSHDFRVGTPDYIPSLGSGAREPGQTKENFRTIRDILDGISLGGDTVEIFGVLKGLEVTPWFSIALGVMDGGLLFTDLWTEDSQKYTSPEDIEAALMVDVAFAALISLIRTGTEMGGVAMLKAALVQALSGVGFATAAVTAILGGLLWAGGRIASNALEEYIRSPSTRDAIIRAVADRPRGMQGVTATV